MDFGPRIRAIGRPSGSRRGLRRRLRAAARRAVQAYQRFGFREAPYLILTASLIGELALG